jgi:hypothetical protein
MKNTIQVKGTVGLVLTLLLASTNAFAMGRSRETRPEACNSLAGTYELLQECTGFRAATNINFGSCMRSTPLNRNMPLPGAMTYYGLRTFNRGSVLRIQTRGCETVRLSVPGTNYVQDLAPGTRNLRTVEWFKDGVLSVEDIRRQGNMFGGESEIPQNYELSREDDGELKITFKDEGCLDAVRTECRLRRIR